MESVSLIITTIAIVVGWGFSVWGVVSYLIDRMDKKMQVEREERTKVTDDLGARIDKIKETHVLREDFHRFVDRLEGQISDMTKGLNSRMDQLFAVIANKGNGINNGKSE